MPRLQFINNRWVSGGHASQARFGSGIAQSQANSFNSRANNFNLHEDFQDSLSVDPLVAVNAAAIDSVAGLLLKHA